MDQQKNWGRLVEGDSGRSDEDEGKGKEKELELQVASALTADNVTYFLAASRTNTGSSINHSAKPDAFCGEAFWGGHAKILMRSQVKCW